MPETSLVAVPVKPFDSAKGRLATSFDRTVRERLSREVASRTIDTIDGAGARPHLVGAGPAFHDWAATMGLESIDDGGGGLDAAARMASAEAMVRGVPWLICHADLPLLSIADVQILLEGLEGGRPVIAPSSDGGTSAIGWRQPLRFRYGTGSFHRHLALVAHADPLVISRIGLLLDLDSPSDLEAARNRREGAWLSDVVGSEPLRR